MLLSNKEIGNLVERFGDRWILRDIDSFPAKLSDMAKVYPYSFSLWKTIVEAEADWEASIISFRTELEAVDASIKVYKALNKRVPDQLYKRYWELNHKK